MSHQTTQTAPHGHPANRLSGRSHVGRAVRGGSASTGGLTLLMLVTMVLATAPASERLSAPAGDQTRVTETRLGRTQSDEARAESRSRSKDSSGQSIHPHALIAARFTGTDDREHFAFMGRPLAIDDPRARTLVRDALLALPPPAIA